MGRTRTIAGVELSWGAATDVGRVRSVNEDSLIAEAPAFAVADGMGGHDAGDVASSLATDLLAGLVDLELEAPESVADAIQRANSEILAAGQALDSQRSMGTTVVGLVLLRAAQEPTWMLFNVGDSRVYRYIDDELHQLSVDHSYVQELIESGQISAIEARTHPERNVVTRALGVEDDVQADLWLRPPVPGERFMLCSDGLTGEIDDKAVATVLGGIKDSQVACEELVSLAVAAGGSDNVTVVIVDVISVEGLDVEEQNTSPRGERAVDPEGPRGIGESLGTGPVFRSGTVDLNPEPVQDLIEVPPAISAGQPFDDASAPNPSGGDQMISELPSGLLSDRSADGEGRGPRGGADGAGDG